MTFTQGFWLEKYEVTQAQWKTVMGMQPWVGEKYVKVRRQLRCVADKLGRRGEVLRGVNEERPFVGEFTR